LQDRARKLGFSEVVIIDGDLGISGLAITSFWRRCVMVEWTPYWQWKRLDLPFEMTPDRRYKKAFGESLAISNAFARCARCSYGITRKTLPIPLARAGQGGPRTVWRLPNYQHLLRMLPEALAYGRTQCQTVVVEGRSRKRGGHRVVMENWQSC